MITLLYSGKNLQLAKAVAKANEVLSADSFYERIASLPGCESQSSQQLSRSLRTADLEITVVSYRNPFGKKATKAAHAFLIKANTSKISSVVAFAVHTLVHQAILNFSLAGPKKQNDKYRPETNKNSSIPSQIGEIAEIISRKKIKHFA